MKLLGLLLLLVTPVQAKETWRTYINERFGFSLQYPSQLVHDSDPIDGAGRLFHTRDKEFQISTAAHFFIRAAVPDESLNTHWEDETNECKGLITYQKKTDSWYVVLGVTTNGFIFYHKYFAQGRNWAGFDITYPQSKKQKYEPWVKKIDQNFMPFLIGKKGQYDRWIE